MLSSTKAGGTFVSDGGLVGIGWLNPSNALSSDNSRATAALTSGVALSEYLKVTNFGFAIPLNSVIRGIVVNVEKSVPFSLACQDNIVKLVKNGVISGNNKADVNNWGTSDATVVYGASNDLWGVELSPNDINSSNFGLVFSGKTSSGFAITLQVDYIEIIVYYDLAFTGTPFYGTVGQSFIEAF